MHQYDGNGGGRGRRKWLGLLLRGERLYGRTTALLHYYSTKHFLLLTLRAIEYGVVPATPQNITYSLADVLPMDAGYRAAMEGDCRDARYRAWATVFSWKE